MFTRRRVLATGAAVAATAALPAPSGPTAAATDHAKSQTKPTIG
jgi:hypothetical protein